MNKLKPCPRCGKDEATLRDNYDSTMFDIICDMCSWTSMVDTEEQAIRLWNQGIVNVSIADYQSLELQNKELKQWKEEMISVMPPMQEIGQELGLKLGDTIHDKILPKIKELREALEEIGKVECTGKTKYELVYEICKIVEQVLPKAEVEEEKHSIRCLSRYVFENNEEVCDCGKKIEEV